MGEWGTRDGWTSHKPWVGGMAAPGLVQSTLGCVPFVLGSGKVLTLELQPHPVPCLAWPAGAAPLASLLAKSRSEGGKELLTLKQLTKVFLGSFLGGFGGRLLVQPAASWCGKTRTVQDEILEEKVGLPCPGVV